MKRKKVRIQVQQTGMFSDDRIVMLSDTLVKAWKIPAQTPITLRFGSASQEVKVVPVHQSGVLRVNESLAATWGLLPGSPLCLKYRPVSRVLRIGPLIGVMISRANSANPERPFGTVTAFCRELDVACRLYGAAVYFVTPDELSGQDDMVKGWQYAGRWTNGSFPVPNVIYNRLTSRKFENRPNVQQFLQYAKTQHRTVMFNEMYLNKSDVFDALRKVPGLHMYLPESYLLKSQETLKSMCAKYSTVFLKPITGSLGKGIIRIRRHPDQSYVCHFTNSGGARKQSYGSLTQLCAALSGKIKQQRYQIQQGLSLITVGGRPVDFRALVQRNERGEWNITSIVARTAGNHHFVSNLARGGSLSSVKVALARSNSTASFGGAIKLRRAALAIAKGIESQVTGHFAELGVDLALDVQGRVWLIEVNSKPSKDDNTQLSDKKLRPSVKRIVQYSRYAAKF
ncbi:YheC/YheD family protein [Paenibacillus piri]|uniref:YheC/YheD family protein n=1 Tax=Paenibacillus piri TaxID=2547395 RepID=A0A4R5KXW9_9BACL|nr:YheC/YheD family protein [Paenibacillus piri]TDG00667.1 YheC/YheD family protein [Paenibacillus piri]